MTLTGTKDLPAADIPHCSVSGLPFGTTAKSTSSSKPSADPVVNKRTISGPVQEGPGTASLTGMDNSNLTDAEKELLHWHYRLGHVAMKRVQWLFRQGVLASSERQRRLQMTAAQLTHAPLCTACQYAKQRCKPEPGTRKKTVPSKQHLLKQDQLFPGQRVSMDHFHASVPGRRLETYGKEAASKRYVGGAIFVDHASGHIHVVLQTHLNSHETLKAKHALEALYHDHGVVVQNYVSDNGTAFRNADFEAELRLFHQHLRAAAVGAHHSNGIAECAISTIMSLTRTMMHHAAIHWPDVSDTAL